MATEEPDLADPEVVDRWARQAVADIEAVMRTLADDPPATRKGI